MTTTAYPPRELELPEFDGAEDSAQARERTAVEAAFDRLTATVRWLYIHCYRDYTGKADYGISPMPVWDGGLGQYGKRTLPVWPKIARAIVALGAEPMDYIRAQFWGKTNVRPPAPNTFYSEEAADTWRSVCVNSRPLDDKLRELHNDRCYVDNVVAAYTAGPKWPAEKATRYALCDKTRVYATPLYRYCLASAHGYDNIAAYYFERALLQLLFCYKAYTAAYGDFIPVALLNAVREIREMLGLTQGT